jgi:outer membrane autotransporter protein
VSPFCNTFLDAVVGYGFLDFDSRRYVTADGSFAAGERDGSQIFGSVTAGYEYRDGGLLLSPYGRLSASRTKLDGFTEEGDSYALRFDGLDFSTVTSTLGIRGEYKIQRSWGSISPRARLEYSHDFDGSSRQKVGYADLGGDEMGTIHDDGEDDDYLALGLGLDIDVFDIWSLGLEYQTAIGQEDEEQHRIQARIAARF